jgi:hypothetical protein
MSKLIEFYEGSGFPYDWEDIIYRWDNDRMESCNDYVYWLFPLPESGDSDVPLLTNEDIEKFKEDFDLMDRVEQSLKKFLEFLGLSLVRFDKLWLVAKSHEFSDRRVVWTTFNQNWLRITRVLKFLKLIGRDDLANAVFSCLNQLRDRDGIARSGNSFSCWKEAIQ